MTAAPAVPGKPSWLLVAAGLGICAGVGSVMPLAATGLALILAVSWWALTGASRWLVAFLAVALVAPPIAGVHPALLFAALGLWAGLARLGEWRFPTDALTLSWLVFFFALLLTVPLAALYSGPAIAMGSLARVLLFGLSLYVFLYVAHGPGGVGEGAIRLLFLAGAVSAAFACADFYFQWQPLADFGQQFVWLPAGMFRRAQGVFYEAGTLGNLCAFFLVLVATGLFRRAPLPRAILLGGGAVFTAALLLSFSRSSLLNLTAAVAALLWLHRRGFRWRRPALVLAASAAVALAILYTAVPAFVEFYGRRWGATVQLWAFPEITLAGRLQSWATLVDFLVENPSHAVLGIGYKTLSQTSFLGRPLIADNMYLSVLVETGLIGLGALAVFLAAILRCSWRLARHADEQVSLLGTWSFCFWVGQLVQMLSVDLLTYWRVLPLYFFVLAMGVRLARRTPDT